VPIHHLHPFWLFLGLGSLANPACPALGPLQSTLASALTDRSWIKPKWDKQPASFSRTDY